MKIVVSFQAPKLVSIGGKAVRLTPKIVERHTVSAEYNLSAGSLVDPFTDVWMINLEDDNHLKALRNITASFPHCFSHFKWNARKGENMLRATCFQFDFDSKGEHDDMTIKEFMDSSFGKKYSWILYTTKSHLKEPGEECFHVIVPLKVPFLKGTEQLFKETSKYVVDREGLRCDNTHDVTRLLNPARASGEELSPNFIFRVHDGEVFDPTNLASIVSRRLQAKANEHTAVLRDTREKFSSLEGVEIRLDNYIDGRSIKKPNEQVQVLLSKYGTVEALSPLMWILAEDIVKNVVEEEYNSWICIATDIQKFCGPSGKGLWTTVCSNSPKYKDSDSDKYDTFDNITMTGEIGYLLARAIRDYGYVVPKNIAGRIIGACRDIESAISMEDMFDMMEVI